MIQVDDRPPSQNGPEVASDEPYLSSASLRHEHVSLREELPQTPGEIEGARQAADKMRAFIARACRSGAVIRDETERKSAQAIIDYWTAELASSPAARESDYVPSLLEQFDDKRSVPATEQPLAAGKTQEKRSREIIRLAATARLWKDSRREPRFWGSSRRVSGFLLVGDAIKQAAQFAHLDPDIAELVRESKRAVTRKRTNYALIAVVAGLATFEASLLAYKKLVPALAGSELLLLSDPLSDYKAKEASLWRLSLYERFMPASAISRLYLSGIRGLGDNSAAGTGAGANLEGIQLYGAGFIQSDFLHVNFKRAELPNSSFVESRIEDTRFEKANLRYSQFRAAEIRSSSYAGAELYRAEFDGARLYDVNFSGAQLFKTSFQAVTMDDSSARHFENTAWWRAVGWSSDFIRKVLPLKQDPNTFKSSKAFETDMDEAKRRFYGLKEGTLERARALNALAWMLATWGIDISTPNAADTMQDCRLVPKTSIPDNALDAALEAVCIANASKLKSENGKKVEEINIIQANFQDTLGYVLLQTNKHTVPPAALESLRQATEVLKDSGGVRFRYAVAQYASGIKGEGLDNLKTSMGAQQYVPSSELQHLSTYIQNTEFLDCVYYFIDKRSPPRQGPDSVTPRCS